MLRMGSVGSPAPADWHRAVIVSPALTVKVNQSSSVAVAKRPLIVSGSEVLLASARLVVGLLFDQFWIISRNQRQSASHTGRTPPEVSRSCRQGHRLRERLESRFPCQRQELQILGLASTSATGESQSGERLFGERNAINIVGTTRHAEVSDGKEESCRSREPSRQSPGHFRFGLLASAAAVPLRREIRALLPAASRFGLP